MKTRSGNVVRSPPPPIPLSIIESYETSKRIKKSIDEDPDIVYTEDDLKRAYNIIRQVERQDKALNESIIIKQAKWLHFYRENVGNTKGITASDFILGFSKLSYFIEHDHDKAGFYERQVLHLCITDQKSNWSDLKHDCSAGNDRMLAKALEVIGHPYEMDRMLDLNNYVVTKEDLIDLIDVLQE